MKATNLTPNKVYRTTEEKGNFSGYMRFSHFDDDRRPHFIPISGICYFPKNGKYVVLPLNYVVYELEPNETTF